MLNRYEISYRYFDQAGAIHYGESIRRARTEWAAEADLCDDMEDQDISIEIYDVRELLSWDLPLLGVQVLVLIGVVLIGAIVLS